MARKKKQDVTQDEALDEQAPADEQVVEGDGAPSEVTHGETHRARHAEVTPSDAPEQRPGQVATSAEDRLARQEYRPGDADHAAVVAADEHVVTSDEKRDPAYVNIPASEEPVQDDKRKVIAQPISDASVRIDEISAETGQVIATDVPAIEGATQDKFNYNEAGIDLSPDAPTAPQSTVPVEGFVNENLNSDQKQRDDENYAAAADIERQRTYRVGTPDDLPDGFDGFSAEEKANYDQHSHVGATDRRRLVQGRPRFPFADEEGGEERVLSDQEFRENLMNQIILTSKEPYIQQARQRLHNYIAQVNHRELLQALADYREQNGADEAR